MLTYALLTSITLLLTIRMFDGIEHGLHWASKPKVNNGEAFHNADLYQTWITRGLYTILLTLLMGRSGGTAFVLVGLCIADQALWQMMLNWKAAGHIWRGELDEAEFSWWPTSRKLFRNAGRAWQLAIGLWLIVLGVYW